jgi:hypothetical protein
MENPFEYQRIVVGETFVDRNQELKTILEAIRSGENLLLYSPRRLGKSSLLKEALRRVQKERICVYVDLWECLTESEIAEKLASGIINATYSTLEKAGSALKEFITSARPLITLEPDGGIGLKLDFFEQEKTLKETLAMIESIAERKKKKAVVVLDECQVIAEFERHRIEKIFRTVIQQQRMVSYLFSGSKQHVLQAMVNQKTRPFYRQLRPMTLGLIPIDAFTPFIKKGFSQVGTIDDSTIAAIYRYGQGNPQRTQQLCHFLYVKAKEHAHLSPEVVDAVVVALCLDLDTEFEDEVDGIKNKRQRMILKALAIDPTGRPLSSEFLQRYTLGPASSVQTALKGLIEKGILDEQYEFVDPLFKAWFSLKYRKII